MQKLKSSKQDEAECPQGMRRRQGQSRENNFYYYRRKKDRSNRTKIFRPIGGLGCGDVKGR